MNRTQLVKLLNQDRKSQDDLVDAIQALSDKAVVAELEKLIKGAYVTDFTKMIQARANELKLQAHKPEDLDTL